VVIGLFSVIVMLAVGAVFYDVVIPWERVPLIVLLLVIGAGCFASLGVAVAGLTPNGQAAPAITNATLLPLAFISGVFFPLSFAPEWLSTVASIFPLRPMVEAVSEQFNPALTPTFPWAEIGVMVAWGVLGVILAARFFTWEPRAAGARRRSRAPEPA
jgi:ABC-2 type transport system permease protein